MPLSEIQAVARWWSKEDSAQAAEDMISTVKTIRLNQQYRKFEDLLYASMFGGLTMYGFGFTANNAFRMSPKGRLSLNVVRNMVGAVTSKIAAKSKPRPTYLTEGGNYELKQQAIKRQKLVEGAFYAGKYYQKRSASFRNSTIFGTGPTKIVANFDTHKVDYEKVMPWELVVDDGEAIYGEPPNLYQRKYYDRTVLKGIFAKDDEEMAKKIDLCSVDSADMEYAYISTADQVLVTEGWHLPSAKDAGDGRHIIAADGVCLFEEEWDDDEFPFTFMRWDEALEGFFGTGLAQELAGIQSEINKILRQIQRGMHLVAGHWLIEKGADVVTQHINNDLASIVKYTGTPPQYHAPSIIAPEMYQHLWNLYNKAFEIAGISQLQATGQKPSGLDSAVAQREYQDINTERFIDVGNRDEECVLDAARLTIKAIRRLAAKGGYRVMSPGNNKVELVDVSEIGHDDDNFITRIYPTSALPATPAGKKAWIKDMMDLGLVPKNLAMELLDFPDTEAYQKRANAAQEIIERNISLILTKGEVVTPEPYDDHALALLLCTQEYNLARLDGVEESHLQILRDYIDATITYLPKTPEPAPTPPMTGSMGAPMPDPAMMPPMQGGPAPAPPPMGVL